jgi:hypothetical protein
MGFSVRKSSLPTGALLDKFARENIYTDCFTIEVPAGVTLAQYITAFYTTSIFKVERVILKWAFSRPSTDVQAKLLAEGETDSFAAWRVEERSENQLLMSDFMGRTRSWLMIEPLETPAGPGTRLYFGSAVVPAPGSSTAGPGFGLMLGFHKIYSEILLSAAGANLDVFLED